MSEYNSFVGGGGGDSVEIVKKTFLNHVFSTTEEGKSEIFNVLQYGLLGVVPIVILNKLIQKFIPEADPGKSSLEIIVEIFLQLVIILVGIVLIHRCITFISPYSGFPYSHLLLTNSILTFLVIVLSIQTKLGIKVNILVERLYDLWNGTESFTAPETKKKEGRVRKHVTSQADTLDETPNAPQPLPVNSKSQGRNNNVPENTDPVAANSMIGSLGGSSFF